MPGSLDIAERKKLIVLVARLRKGVILPPEELELRSLVGREFPTEAATLDQERLGLFGLGMMGAWYLFNEEPMTKA